jgi:uncharacterized protein YutE (UPF0331/DUF86 family)
MARREVLRKRLNKLDEYLAIEAVTDMGTHLVADLELGVVNCYRDISYEGSLHASDRRGSLAS